MLTQCSVAPTLGTQRPVAEQPAFKKYGKITDVDNKLAMDAVFGKNMEAFPKSDDEDEYCDSDGDTEDSDSDDDSDASSNNGDDVSAAVIDRGHT
jgi:hypothetical protein